MIQMSCLVIGSIRTKAITPSFDQLAGNDWSRLGYSRLGSPCAPTVATNKFGGESRADAKTNDCEFGAQIGVESYSFPKVAFDGEPRSRSMSQINGDASLRSTAAHRPSGESRTFIYGPG